MSAGFPGVFPGGLTTGYTNIGAVRKLRNSFGYPGTFPGGLSIGYISIGAVQKADPITSTMAATYTPGYTFAGTATFTAPAPVSAPAGGAGPALMGSRRKNILPELDESVQWAVLGYAYV